MQVTHSRSAGGKRRKRAAGAARGHGSEVSSRGAGAGDQARVNLYDEVTVRIIAEMEAGRVPWVQPWGRVDGASAGLPRNAKTGRSYSGINVLILWGAVIGAGYPSQGWLTFRQALEAGGSVRKGERGTVVVYADRFVPEAEKARAVETGGDARTIPFLKRFTVFNVAQCDGLPADFSPEPVPLPEREIVPVAEAVIAASGVAFRIGGSEAYYAPHPDFVQVPPQSAFFVPVNYYRTALHELTHATGHPSRLGRTLILQDFAPHGPRHLSLREAGHQYEGRVRKLLAEHITAHKVETVVEPFNIFDENAITAELQSGRSAASVADEIASQISRTITENWDEDPAFYEAFSKLVQATIDGFRQKRISEQEYLTKARSLKDQAHARAESKEVPAVIRGNGHAVAFWGILSKELAEISPEAAHHAANIALALLDIVEGHRKVGWQEDRDA